LFFLFTLLLLIPPSYSQQQELIKPEIQLATIYQVPFNINDYWVSEKLDGIRGYWTGEELVTRNGNIIITPPWFTKDWPKAAMEGELWSQRGQFEKISSCVRRKNPAIKIQESCWRDIKFMLFDLPKNKSNFTHRIQVMTKLVHDAQSPYLHVISQFKLATVAQLNTTLVKIVQQGGEGLMLHYQAAYYQQGRSKHIMKLKQHNDAEGVVIGHIEGKGKYRNMLGSLVVKTSSGIVFRLGSGFTDQQRQSPPIIGSTVTYKYIGKTQRGVPRFASFLRVRKTLLTQ
jgi:DNA ligase-1